MAQGIVGVGVALVLAAGGGGDLGAAIFYNAKPPCIACHNERQGDLRYSRSSREEIKEWVRRGKKGAMPAYPFNEQELDAVADFVLRLRGSK